jgi:hypothetical protein
MRVMETIAALDNENGSNRIRPYFAYQVGILNGPQLFVLHMQKPLGLYYGVCAFTLWFSLSFYAFVREGTNGLKVFWTIILHLL